MITPVKEYVAGGDAFLYPGAGDSRPPGGAKVLLLTRHGICIIGHWQDGTDLLGWAPLPRRNKEKEARING